MREPPQSSSSYPPPSSSPFLRDISNVKTPKPSLQNPNPSNPPSPLPLFFTASKKTPFSSSSSGSAFRRRPAFPPSASKSKAARRLKAFELEQSQSSRKAQIRREKTIKTLSRSLTAWLNFLFENPKSCGCAVAACDEQERSELVVSGKRDSLEGRRIAIDRPWRSPKRQRSCSSSSAVGTNNAVSSPSPASTEVFLPLETSLNNVCSFEDLKERMKICLSVNSQNEVLSTMAQVTKNIDEGRLKMKAHCPLVIDVGLKEKATKILMSYNKIWLRFGLYIVLGGDSLLSTEDGNSDQDDMFLKMIIEKQFYTHAGLAKSYAYNKMVEGLYRPGYFQALGNIILKRFLLLVLVLDKAKCQSTLPIKYGVDGTDGEFLSPVMHGEGDLLAHLAIIGYKVSHQQCPLAEFDFSLTDLFEDIQDGIRLCRIVQLLQQDASILTKVTVPSDTRKKNLLNCGVAMQYLNQAGVPLSDEDGTCIVAEDIANGDKELILSLLWNIFVHLQLPLLINKSLLVEEMSKIKGSVPVRVELTVARDDLTRFASLKLMLGPGKEGRKPEICENYHLKVDNFASLTDGKALCYLFDYYLENELHGYSYFQDAQDTSNEESILSKIDKMVVLNNFILIQRVTTMLGNFPEDQLNIQKLLGWKNHIPDTEPSLSPFANPSATAQPVLCIKNAGLSIAEKALSHLGETMVCNEVARYSSEDVEKKIKSIQRWWRAMEKKKHDSEVNSAISDLKQDARYHLSDPHGSEIQRVYLKWVAIDDTKPMRYLMVESLCKFDAAVQLCLIAKKVQQLAKKWKLLNRIYGQKLLSMPCFNSNSENLAFQQYKVAAVEVQRFARVQIALNKLLGAKRSKASRSAVIIQSYVRGWLARCKASRSRDRIILIQSYWKGYIVRKESREQLLCLRQRVQESATNVDNSMRLVNRLVAALSQLLSDRVSNILHTYLATGHSEKCCETLVTAGAIGALLNQIHAANRSAPCQVVRKHALSTLRNLSRYPRLAEVLINTPGSVETIFQELLRNKDDGYFIAADLLKKLCSSEEGIEAVHKLPVYLKRLSNLAEDLERKANLEKRNPRLVSARENTEQRLREAVELLHLAANG
ncbi:hypothetical protein ACLOJK_039482 [Asimina triloba]